MKSIYKVLFSVVVLAAADPASAGICTSGLLADIACVTGLVTPRQAQQLDNIHRGVGRPLNNFNPLQQRGFGATTGRHGVPMGNRCYTPAGVSDFGESNPLGAPCSMWTPYGAVQGRVGR